jgi:hypothetical protein
MYKNITINDVKVKISRKINISYIIITNNKLLFI